MRKIIALGLFALIGDAACLPHTVDVKVRAAYTHFNSHLVRDIYSGPALCTQLETDVALNKYISVFGNIDYLCKSGNSDDLKNRTTLDMADLSLGARLSPRYFKSIFPYLGIGIIGAIIHTHDYYDWVKKITNRYSTGVIAKSGVSFLIKKHVTLDFFCDYSYQPVHVYYRYALNKTHLDVGSIKLGGGIGARF